MDESCVSFREQGRPREVRVLDNRGQAYRTRLTSLLNEGLVLFVLGAWASQSLTRLQKILVRGMGPILRNDFQAGVAEEQKQRVHTSRSLLVGPKDKHERTCDALRESLCQRLRGTTRRP